MARERGVKESIRKTKNGDVWTVHEPFVIRPRFRLCPFVKCTSATAEGDSLVCPKMAAHTLN